MSIEIVKTATGYGIKFPYQLNEQFKRTFTTAKWSTYSKQWQVGPRSLKRLEAWKTEAEAAAAAVDARAEADLADQELERVRAQLFVIARDAGEIEKSTADAIKARELLEQAGKELAEAQARKEAAATALRDERARVNAIMNQVFDVAAVKAAVAAMSKHMVRRDRAKFREAEAVVDDAYYKLREAGFGCRALNEAASANFNRPDRDDPANIPEADWYVLGKYVSEPEPVDEPERLPARPCADANSNWGVRVMEDHEVKDDYR